MAYGWISIHRKIKECWVWEDKPFSKGQAWIDLLLSANHDDKKVVLGSELITVQKGSFITSIRKLCTNWGWSNTKVISFLKLLEQDKMITYFSDTKKTLVTIENYGLYQDEEIEKRHVNDTKATQKHTNNNDNNISSKEDIYTQSKKPKKLKYADYVSMTEKDYKKLVDKYGEGLTKKMIEVLDNYKGAKGKQYKSDYHAILNWVVDKVTKEQPKQPSSAQDFNFDGL